MKKIVILSVGLLFLTACTAIRNNAGNDVLNPVTGSAITGSNITVSAVSGSTVSAVAVSGAAVKEDKKRVKKGKKKICFVIDKTGKKRKLKLDAINTENAGVRFLPSDPAGVYSQISDGHYYYLKSDGQYNYTIYQDKGDVIGRFSFDIDTDAAYNALEYFVRYGTEYYAIFVYGYDQGLGSILDDKYYLAHVDLKTEKLEPLLELYDRTVGYSTYLYQGEFYFEDLNTMEDKYYNDWEYGDFVKIDLERGFSETTLPITDDMGQQLPCLFFMDGKVYYGRQKGKKVTLYSYDLESQQEEKILCYEREKKYNKSEWGDDGNTWLEMDEDYIYCQDYIIPRDGGEMIPLFRQARLFHNIEGPREMPYAYNKRYVFYIDKKCKVHRYSKKTSEDVVISDIKAMDVKCTEDSVYVQEYDKHLSHEEYFDGPSPYAQVQDDPSFSNIYCMDMDGKHVEKIAEKVLPYLD